MLQIFEVMISGLSQGAVYCVFAFGLSLVYGTSRVLNFAHGSLYMLGAYLAWYLVSGPAGFGYPLMFAIVVPTLFLVGVCVEWGLVRPLRRYHGWKTATMMATLGLAFVLDNLFLILAGPQAKTLPNLVDGTFSLGAVVVSFQELVIFVTAIAVVIGLEVFLSASRHGRAMRAVAQDAQGAQMVGIRVDQVFAYTFGLSVTLAGVAGVLLAPIYLVSPLGGWPPFLKAFVIVVFGGLGSTRGVVYAAFILSMVEAAVVFTLGAAWTMPVWLLILLAVLMFRPQGLLGVWAE